MHKMPDGTMMKGKCHGGCDKKKSKKSMFPMKMKKGAFTKQATGANMTVKGFTKKVLSNPSQYKKRTVMRARLAKTLSKFN
jgi:hypothetical protein|tara:strand:- start:2126 stop:2368 length:243 start_codon:yes stop_codon:yes gene_type:complete